MFVELSTWYQVKSNSLRSWTTYLTLLHLHPATLSGPFHLGCAITSPSTRIERQTTENFDFPSIVSFLFLFGKLRSCTLNWRSLSVRRTSRGLKLIASIISSFNVFEMDVRGSSRSCLKTQLKIFLRIVKFAFWNLQRYIQSTKN